MKLDQICSTWLNIDEVYKKQTKRISKLDFLKQMLSDKALMVARKAAMSDFETTDDNVEKLNMLFSTLENASSKLSNCTQEPESLYEFIWGCQAKPCSPNDFNPFYIDGVDNSAKLIDAFLFRNCYYLEDNQIKHLVCKNDGGVMIHFENPNDVLAWLCSNAKTINNSDEFIKGVYAFVLMQMENKGQLFPMSFVNAKVVEPNNAEKDIVLNDTYKTVEKVQFSYKGTARVSTISNDFGKDKVVYIE